MFLGSSRFLFHRSHLLQGDLYSDREEPRRDQRARKGVGVATKFLKPSRRMMFIQSEMSSTRRHDDALCASRNRSHRHLGRRYAFVMCHFEPMNDGMLAVASFGNFAHIPCLMERQGRSEGARTTGRIRGNKGSLSPFLDSSSPSPMPLP